MFDEDRSASLPLIYKSATPAHTCMSECWWNDETTSCKLLSPPRRCGGGADLIRACRSANWTAAERGDPPWGGWWMAHQLADGAVLPQIQVLVMKSNVFGCFFCTSYTVLLSGLATGSNLFLPSNWTWRDYICCSPAGSRTHRTNTVHPRVDSG